MTACALDIDKILPQTQCGECGYAGCLPYAEALALGSAPIDRCPPGGVKTLRALGELLDVDPKPYLSEMQHKTRSLTVAVIREEDCIGCTKCIQACPVDAIVGSAKWMHTILAYECTGCGLCVEPCPVDCIELVTVSEESYEPATARRRFNAKKIRTLQEEKAKQQYYREKSKLALNQTAQQEDKAAKQAYILKALQRQMKK